MNATYDFTEQAALLTGALVNYYSASSSACLAALSR